ncbi:hypothetical protein JA9_004932 [Meyerozyma sp. JA9]|jgi:nicotinamidase-related amidase|nr:hypothetical protein JA9_004932 [Meyerozyma sp. JA9]
MSLAIPPVEFDSSDPSSPSYYKPSETALLLLDFHSAFLGFAAAAPAALEKAASLRTWAKAQGIHVIHALISDEIQPSKLSRASDKLSGFLDTIKKSGGHVEAAKLLEGADNEPKFLRRPGLISALTSSDIREHLQKQGIKSLILTGISSSNCVMRTGIMATELDFVTTVISDACADPQQDIHEVVMTKILPGRAHVTTAEEFEKNYKK